MISRRTPLYITGLLCCALLAEPAPAGNDNQSTLSVLQKTASSGNHYLLLQAGEPLAVDFAVARPQVSDPETLLCIPAAFTSARGSISGFYALKGVSFNLAGTDRAISGAIEFKDGNFRIFDTDRGALINKEMIERIKTEKTSMFQQFQVVKGKQAEPFKDKTHYQRRCIANMSDGKRAIIESDESITLTAFAKDLVELGVNDAVYTDMGEYDEGWYKDPSNGRAKAIGQIRLKTDKQSNWVVFKKR